MKMNQNEPITIQQNCYKNTIFVIKQDNIYKIACISQFFC